MLELINIQKVVVGPKHLVATLNFAPGGPVMTNANPQATERVKWLLPEIMRHACTGDAGKKFGTSLSRTEIAHLVEHVTLELMALSSDTTPIISGRTRRVADHLYEVEIAAPDDVLAVSALCSAVFIVNWAFQARDNKGAPNVEAIVAGIRRLMGKTSEIEEELQKKKEAEEAKAAAEAKARAEEEEAAQRRAAEEAAAAEVEKLENKPSETGALGSAHLDAPSAVSEPTPRDPKFMTGPIEVLSPTDEINVDSLASSVSSATEVSKESSESIEALENTAAPTGGGISPGTGDATSAKAPGGEARSESAPKETKAPEEIHLGTTVGFMNPSAPKMEDDF